MAIILVAVFFSLSPQQARDSAKPNLKDILRASVVSVISYDAGGNILVRGSGFFVSESGEVLTRKSLIPPDAGRTEVVTTDAKTYRVTGILATDDKIDLVRVALEATPPGARPLAKATFSPQFGDRVFVISRGEADSTLTDGVVTEQPNRIFDKTFVVTISTDTPPSSGSPVFNSRGEVVGVAMSAKDSQRSFPANALQTDSPLYPVGATFQPTGDIKEESPPALVRRSDQFFQGSAITRVAPAYPAIAKRERVDGMIVVQVLVGENGEVLSAEVIKAQLRRHIGKEDEIPIAAEQALKVASVEAVRQWKFTPTILGGKPIKVLGTLTLNFHL